MNKDEAREAAEFEAKAKKFREERSKAWAEYIDLSSEAGYTIEDTLTNRTLFMGGYESGKDAGASSVDRKAVEVLRKTVEQYDGSDNGICAVCRIGHRKYDLKCNIGICEWAECLSHEWREVLAEMEENNENSKM